MNFDKIIYKDAAHEGLFLALLEKSGYSDPETAAALYLIALIGKPFKVADMFDLSTHSIFPDAVNAEWMHGSSRRAFKLACHLFNNFNNCQVSDVFGGSDWDKYFLQAVAIRYGIDTD